MVTHALSHADRDAEAWLSQLAERHGAENTARIRQALAYLHEHGHALTADSGAPLTEHALASAMQLASMGLDADTLAAALLCGLPEQHLKAEQLTPAFGVAVNRLIQGSLRLARMDHLLSDSPVEGGQSEALRQMLLAMTDDIRVVLIKLAERTCTLRELAKDDKTKRHKAALETRELYAPLWETLDKLGVARTDVVGATVFTTGDIVLDTSALGDKVLAAYQPAAGLDYLPDVARLERGAGRAVGSHHFGGVGRPDKNIVVGSVRPAGNHALC